MQKFKYTLALGWFLLWRDLGFITLTLIVPAIVIFALLIKPVKLFEVRKQLFKKIESAFVVYNRQMDKKQDKYLSRLKQAS